MEGGKLKDKSYVRQCSSIPSSLQETPTDRYAAYIILYTEEEVAWGIDGGGGQLTTPPIIILPHTYSFSYPLPPLQGRWQGKDTRIIRHTHIPTSFIGQRS